MLIRPLPITHIKYFVDNKPQNKLLNVNTCMISGGIQECSIVLTHIYITALFQLIKKVCDYEVNFGVSAIIAKKYYAAYMSRIYIADWHYSCSNQKYI